ncbi:hypothetical protein EON80_04430 [bacterium]|nr:MAG: hypothetical protein EON80_04430 [bacterium]
MFRTHDRTGPYRTTVSRVEHLDINGIDAAAGFDTKLRIWVADLGQLPGQGNTSRLKTRMLTADLKLVGQDKERTTYLKAGFERMSGDRNLQIGSKFSIERPFGSRPHNNPEMPVTVWIDSKAFPKQSAIYLEGTLQFKLWVRNPAQWGESNKLPAAPLRFKYLVRKANQFIEPPVPKPANTQIESLNATYLSPSYQHNSRDGNNVLVRMVLENSGVNWREDRPYWLDNRVIDRRGKSLPVIRPLDLRSLRPSGNRVFYEFRAAIDIPDAAGKLLANGAFSMDDSAPTKYSVLLRPEWMTSRPRKLKLESIGVQGGDVYVVVRYAGALPVIFQDTKSGPGYGIGHSSEFLDNRDDLYYNSESQAMDYAERRKSKATYPLEWDERVFWWDDEKRDYLITNWSQHLTFGGSEDWSAKSVSVKSITNLGAGRYRVIYQTSALNILKPGERCRFNAKIGLKGDGFLTINTTMTRGK